MSTQTETRFTPGPWRWSRLESGDLQLVTEHRPVPLNDPVIFAVREDWRGIGGTPNAHLIAAAPEMDDALWLLSIEYHRAAAHEQLRRDCTAPHCVYVRGVLAKARGEG